LAIKNGIKVVLQEKRLQVEALDAAAEGMNAVAGSTRAHLANMVTGVTKGYEKKLELVGVGYRAAVQAKNLTLTLGYSHLINYAIPDGISIETPSQTEIIVKGIDRQRVGQTAAEIRGFRPPEPYKGKGVKYSDETISLKEAKKK
jgi:large subunit ribosomal protein L6